MINFYPEITRSLVDIPNSPSLMIHFFCYCNFNCMECLNKEDIVMPHACTDRNMSLTELIEKIEAIGSTVDNLIFSGGEPTTLDTDELILIFKKIKCIFSGNIVLYTNGSFPSRLKKIIDSGAVDTVFMDVKFPYWQQVTELDVDLKGAFEEVLGIEYKESLCKSLLDSIDLLSKKAASDENFTVGFRTVKYPILDDSFFTEIDRYLTCKKLDDESDFDWKLNPFISKSEFVS